MKNNKYFWRIVIFIIAAFVIIYFASLYIENKQLIAENKDLKNNISEYKSSIKHKIEFCSPVSIPSLPANSYDFAMAKVQFLKRGIERGGFNCFYGDDNKSIKKREKLAQSFYGMTFSDNSMFDINREPNNGRGSVDFKVSIGSSDKTLVEFKLASNKSIKNLLSQVNIYENDNETKQSIKVILFFSQEQENKVKKQIKRMSLESDSSIVLIDARNDNKPSASIS